MREWMNKNNWTLRLLFKMHESNLIREILLETKLAVVSFTFKNELSKSPCRRVGSSPYSISMKEDEKYSLISWIDLSGSSGSLRNLFPLKNLTRNHEILWTQVLARRNVYSQIYEKLCRSDFWHFIVDNFQWKNPFDKCLCLVMLLIYFVVIREKTLSVTNDTVNGIVLGSIILEKEKSVRPHWCYAGLSIMFKSRLLKSPRQENVVTEPSVFLLWGDRHNWKIMFRTMCKLDMIGPILSSSHWRIFIVFRLSHGNTL